jgi:acyl carrier protein
VTQQDVLDKLKEILMVRLRFDPQRAAQITLETTLPKTVEGSLGLDSLDILELLLGIEEEFKIMIDEREDLTAEFLSLDSLSRFVLAKTGRA